MFSKLIFRFSPDSKMYEKSVVLHARDVHAKYFEICSDSHRIKHGTLPALRIIRSYKDLKTDPYNEDGRPPTVLTTIVHPYVEFLESYIQITGFESPSLCFAGLPRPAYDGCPPLDLPPEQIWQEPRKRPSELEDMPKQIIVLTR